MDDARTRHANRTGTFDLNFPTFASSNSQSTAPVGRETDEAEVGLETLDAARQGDDQAIARLFRAMQPLLLRYLRQLAPAVAEDIASETWLHIAQALPRFDGDIADFRALLFTIARRRLIDNYRQERRRPILALTEDLDQQVDHQDAADRALEELSAQQAIKLLVASLPPGQAEVVLLRVVAGLSTEQAARVTGRSAGAVRVLQHRALRNLAKIFK